MGAEYIAEEARDIAKRALRKINVVQDRLKALEDAALARAEAAERERDALREAAQKVLALDIHSFGMSRPGEANVMTEGSDRFVHERDVKVALDILRAALKAPAP